MKKHSVISNMLFVFKKLILNDKKYFWDFLLKVIIAVVLPIILALIPSFVVSSITLDTNFYAFILVLFMVLLTYILLNSLQIYVNDIIDFRQTTVRVKNCFVEIGRKSLTMNYANLEPYSCRERSQKAFSALSSNWVGIEGMMKRTSNIIITLLGIVVYACIIWRISWIVVLILVGMSFITAVIAILTSKLYDKEQNKMTEFTTKHYQTSEMMKNETYTKDLRVYNYKPFFISYTTYLMKRISKSYLVQAFLDGMPMLLNTIFAIARDLICYFILIKGVIDGSFTLVDFTFYLSIIMGLSSLLNDLSNTISALYFNNVDVNNYRSFLDWPDNIKHCGGRESNDLLDKGLSIEFKDVSFTYPDSDKKTLDGLSFKINSKENIALVGINGAGKTTIVKLLTGMYQPQKGEILINGIKASDFNIEAYYALFGAVFQDDVAFDYTIAENVSMKHILDTDRQKVYDAIEKAGLKDMVDKLPCKIDTYIGKTFTEEGIRLSGGELQKLILARALYKNAPILILDEPTAALDPIAEAELYLKYDALTKDKTSLFISHRLSSTKFCDRILFLENGHVLEEGTHDELLKLRGKYYEMFEMQAKYYKEGTENEKN